MGKATRYYTADGYYLPGANAPDLLPRKERVLDRIRRVHEDLKELGTAHEETRYGCMQSGTCCRVGLVVHNAELEIMARELSKKFEEDRAYEKHVIKKLKKSLTDEEWTMGEGIGDLLCAFYEDGCTVYPFRPSVCRMYGTIMELNDDCPRERLASGREFIWVRPEADAVVKALYRAVDDYGSLFPRADCSRYLAAGLLMFLQPRKEVEEIKARTDPKFWRTLHGYRTQYVTSKRQEPYEEKVPRFPVNLKLNVTAKAR
jgi:Fe-S-cluster containining protein